jgi:phosphate transport system permease protein
MNLYTTRRISNRVGLALSIFAMLVGLGVLVWILGTLLIKGVGALSPRVFTQMTPPPGSDGGLLNALVGSLIMVSVATLIATPTGVMAGIYLSEFGRRSWVTPVTRFVNDILLSAPSIILGLFVYAVYVSQVKHFSGWAGCFALGLIAIPVVVRATDNMLSLVPNTLREAAAALGAPKWKMVLFVTLRAARAGVITGVLLAVARISGETAPLLFTALNNQFWSTHLNGPMANLPSVIFQFAMSPYEDWKRLAWVGALLITLSVLVLSIVARSVARQRISS